LAIGSFTSKSYIKLLDWEAERALKRLENTGQITVVVQDNGSLHRSQQVQAKWREWQDKGLYFFFLPKYCSQMNLIEPEWHQLKTHELAGRMFEDEYDLASAVMEGIEERSQRRGYSTERFKFNSTKHGICDRTDDQTVFYTSSHRCV
jgi:transposase